MHPDGVNHYDIWRPPLTLTHGSYTDRVGATDIDSALTIQRRQLVGLCMFDWLASREQDS